MLNIYESRASRDSLAECLDGIARDLENLRKEPPCTDAQVVLIVPAQFTLAAEEAAFRRFRAKGFFDFHIMSGARLNQAVLRECGGPGCAPINTLGRRLLLRRIAVVHKDELRAFGRVCGQTEFLKMAGDFIVQMKQNQWTAEDLSQIRGQIASRGEGGLLEKKLADMEIFSAGYAKAMEGKFTDSEDMLRWVAEKMPTGMAMDQVTTRESREIPMVAGRRCDRICVTGCCHWKERPKSSLVMMFFIQ